MTLLDTQREASAFALPLQGVVKLETITFLTATALQHCKLSILLSESGGFLPPYRFNCLWACSFHCQFPRSEIGLSGHRALAFRGHKLLDFLSKFADGFAVVEMPLMP